MKYSELIEAIDQNDRSKANKILAEITTHLKRYLKIHMNANRQDAEDCVQQTLIKSLDAIEKGKIRDKDRILSFMITTTRNTYLNHLQKHDKNAFDEISEDYTQQPRQLLALLDEERKKILQWCIKQLSDRYRKFIEFWFEHPDSNAKAVATHFDTTTGNVWTHKHRIVKKLSECCRKKNNI